MRLRRHAPVRQLMWLVLVAVVTAILAVVFADATASAATNARAETRVGAISHVGEVPVGPPEDIAAVQRLGEAAPQPVFVVVRPPLFGPVSVRVPSMMRGQVGASDAG